MRNQGGRKTEKREEQQRKEDVAERSRWQAANAGGTNPSERHDGLLSTRCQYARSRMPLQSLRYRPEVVRSIRDGRYGLLRVRSPAPCANSVECKTDYVGPDDDAGDLGGERYPTLHLNDWKYR